MRHRFSSRLPVAEAVSGHRPRLWTPYCLTPLVDLLAARTVTALQVRVSCFVWSVFYQEGRRGGVIKSEPTRTAPSPRFFFRRPPQRRQTHRRSSSLLLGRKRASLAGHGTIYHGVGMLPTITRTFSRTSGVTA